MRKKIESPKVFISYAWGDEEYQNQVLSFASQLVSDGIDVVFDKWDLTEGNDTYAFMEKCATDPSITNVLMLLDPIYAKKADEHTGGVGTETQIISAKVYKEVTQDKFIPVVMKRDENGAVCKPTYLEGRLHFDLSVPESYDSTYQRLVKTLFGEEVYAKPDLGQKPKWVEQPIVIPTKTMIAFESLKGSAPETVKRESWDSFLQEMSNSLIEYSKADHPANMDNAEYLKLYDGTEDVRNNFLQLLQYTPYIHEGFKNVASFFEQTKNAVSQISSLTEEVVSVRIHEMFIYAVAHYLKKKDYKAVGYLLGRTYFSQIRVYNESGVSSFHMFYSGSNHTNLDNAVKQRDNKRYYTGTGQHWIETLSSQYITKEQFVLADLICFNYCVYGKKLSETWAWFPITYVYDNEYNSSIGTLGRKLISREFVEEILPMFGHKDIDAFISKFKEVESAPKGSYKEYRYSESFNSAGILGYFITSDKIASLD